jgi:hypothetical protein
VVPPDLLVIRMGVKQARNQAACEVLAEALQTRLHEGKPTWLWDEPHHPLNPGHLFWSDAVGRIISAYPQLDLGARPGSEPPGKKKSTNPSGKRVRKTLRGGSK